MILVSLVAFADARNNGYGAVVFVQITLNSWITIYQLVCAKSIKKMSSLKLCAVLLLNIIIEGYIRNVSVQNIYWKYMGIL